MSLLPVIAPEFYVNTATGVKKIFDSDGNARLTDGTKIYISSTTETYFVFNAGAVELWINGVKKQTWS
jgi:hypothetical protein